MVFGEGAVGPDDQAEDQEGVDAARCAVAELDKALDGGELRNYFAVAEGPVIAASGAGASSAHISAPQHDGNVVNQHSPGVARESGDAEGLTRTDFGNSFRLDHESPLYSGRKST